MEDNFQVVSASITDRGLSEKRPQNEDSLLDLARYGIFAVADGVGGAQAGDVASQMAMEILGEAFTHKAQGTDAEIVLRAAIESANTAIFQMSHDLPQLATMATTIVALHLEGNIATIGHVGDSRIYRMNSSGSITQETDDHSVVAEEVRAGRMTPEQAAVHPSRNVISRALGAEATVDVELKTMMVEPGTSFVLCSDGITRHVQDSELESILGSDSDLDEVCQNLKQICYDRGAEDNLTAVVVRIKGDSVIPAAEEILPTNADSEVEEDTIATARSPFDDVAEPIVADDNLVVADNHPVDEVDESILQVEDVSVPSTPETGEILDLSPEILPVIDESGPVEVEPDERKTEVFVLKPLQVEPKQEEPAIVEPALVEPVPIATPAPASVVQPVQTYVEKSSPSRGFVGSFLTSFLLLVLGAAAGSAGMYFFFQPRTTAPETTPVIPVAKPTPTFSAFEDLRRKIDTEPTSYLDANKAFESDADAADFYLRGRAFLRIEHYYEAKQAFIEAKKRLKPTDPDAATLNFEIALAMAVINNQVATELLKKDMDEWASTSPASTVTNSNSAITAPSNVNRNTNANR